MCDTESMLLLWLMWFLDVDGVDVVGDVVCMMMFSFMLH